jgi:hypothetical protein
MSEEREVAFELERFAWTPPDRLEVVGRWSGLEGRRLGRPLLTLVLESWREPLTAQPGKHFGPGGTWRALFTYDGRPEAITGAELEIGRRLVVDLPPPRRRRPRSDGKALEEERTRRQELEATLADREAEITGLRDEAETAIGKRDDEIEKLRGEVEQMTAAVAAAQAERDRAQLELSGRDAEITALRDDAEQRLAAERAASTEVREKLATAREEAHSTIETEAQETERLRAELQAARDEAERAVNAEREETARLREELAATSANGAEDDGEAETAAKRMYERVARELERERAAARHLRRELDAVQAETAEHRRIAAAASADGVAPTDEAPVAATPAGRLAASRRTDAGRAAAHHRADVARAAAAHRDHSQQSTGSVWVVRVIALVIVIALLIALLQIVNAVT